MNSDYKNYAAGVMNSIQLMLSMKKLPAEDLANLKILRRNLELGAKFALPDYGSIFDDDLKCMKGVRMRLPYPVTVIEFDRPGLPDLDGHDYDVYHVVLAMEGTITGFCDMFGYGKENLLGGEEDEDVILIQNFVKFNTDNPIAKDKWVPSPLAFFISTNWDDVSDVDPVELAHHRPEDGVYLKIGALTVMPGVTQVITVRDHGGDWEEYARKTQDVNGPAIKAVAELCEVLCCSNVSVDVVSQANEERARKRKKQGKLPLFDYHTLVQTFPKEKKAVSEPLGGTHSSPRLHLRQGHPRRKPHSEEWIWIQAYMAGDISKGVIDKSYVVRKGAV